MPGQDNPSEENSLATGGQNSISFTKAMLASMNCPLSDTIFNSYLFSFIFNCNLMFQIPSGVFKYNRIMLAESTFHW